MQDDRRPFLDVAEVASLLAWHPNTVRDHLVPLTEWQHGSEKIPSIRLGGRHFVPRWWIDHVKALGRNPPDAEPAEDRTGKQKSTGKR